MQRNCRTTQFAFNGEILCYECSQPFTQGEWDNTMHSEEDLHFHEGCCPFCKK